MAHCAGGHTQTGCQLWQSGALLDVATGLFKAALLLIAKRWFQIKPAKCPTFDSLSFNHLHSTMKRDTAAPTANWIMTTLRLLRGSSLGPAHDNMAQHNTLLTQH